MSRQFDFQNLDLYSCQDFDNLRIPCSEPMKTLVGTAAEASDIASLNMQQEFFYQKSAQMLTEVYEISFEKDFIKEHQAVFQKMLQNYMESFRIYSNKIGVLSFQNQLLNKPQNKTQTCLEFIKIHEFQISHEQTQNFVKKLSTYDKLSEFLSIVVSICPEKISTELILLAKELLEGYEQVRIELPSQADLLNLAEEVARNPKFVELTNLKVVSLNKCREATDLIEKSKQFMEIYCATTILVIDQYFQNPYSSEEMGCFKRQLSPWCSEDDEQEEELSSTPAKKRKYSF